MSFSEVLSKLMLDSGTSNLALANAIGISDTAVGKWKSGVSSPSLENALAIAKYFGISIDDLAEYNTGSRSFYTRIPVIGTVSVYGIYTCEFFAEDYVTVETSELQGYAPEECFALRVRDDSLSPAHFANVSYIIFHQQSQCADGDFIIVQKKDSDEILYKQWAWKGGSIELTAPNVQTLTVQKRDINKLRIHAVMIGSYTDI